MARNIDLTEGNVNKQLLRLAFPIFLSTIFQELYTVTNSLIVGNFIDTLSLSAISACTWICNIFSYTFYGLGLGAGILVAQKYGAKDAKGLKTTLDTSLVFGIVGGILLTIVSEICLPLMMKASNIAPDIYDIAQQYLRIYLIGNSAVLTYQICFYVIRNMGDSKHQLYYMIFSSVLNLVLGVIFVRYLNMGVAGTAIATIISQLIVVGMCLKLLFSFDGIDFDINNISFDFKTVIDICKIGIPAGIQNMLIAISGMMIQAYTNLFSNATIAGIGVGEKLGNWGQRVSNAYASASQAMVAQNIGGKKYDRVKQTVKDSVLVSSVFTVISVILVFVFAPQLVSMFDKDPEVIKVGTAMTRCLVPSCIFINLSHIYNSVCRASGNVTKPMLIAIFAQVVCKYLFVYIGLKISFDVRVIYFGTAFGYTCAGILATLYFYFGKWSKQAQLR